MSKYVVRVELHGVTSNSALFLLLHQEMQKRGFTRTILSSEGMLYALPTAEYNYEGEMTGEEVRSAAKAAAALTGRPASILVTEAKARWWSGLQEA